MAKLLPPRPPKGYHNNFVSGDGPIPCRVMLIGEAPGEREDQEGKPFVGAAGRVLTKLLNKFADLKRNEVYITNAVKHRPPLNRKPTIEEILFYRDFLLAEIEVVNPEVIVTLGTTAFEAIKGKQLLKPLREACNDVTHFHSQGAQILITYHPAALLRSSNFLPQIKKDFGILKGMLK